MGLVGIARPASLVGMGKKAYLLVGSLAHPGSGGPPFLPRPISPIWSPPSTAWCVHRRGDGVWRFDRMATVCDPGSGRVTAWFAGVAKHYGVAVASVHRGAATARAWWKRSTTPPRNAGGAPWPTT